MSIAANLLKVCAIAALLKLASNFCPFKQNFSICVKHSLCERLHYIARYSHWFVYQEAMQALQTTAFLPPPTSFKVNTARRANSFVGWFLDMPFRKLGFVCRVSGEA